MVHPTETVSSNKLSIKGHRNFLPFLVNAPQYQNLFYDIAAVNKSLSLFPLDEFVLFQTLEEERNPIVQGFNLVLEMLCHTASYVINRLSAIAMFPEKAADFIQLDFVMGSLKFR